MSQRLRLISVGVALCAALLAGCSTPGPALSGEPEVASPATSTAKSAATGASADDNGSAVAAVRLTQITDVPIPREARLDEAASLVLGSGDRWLGRLVFHVKTNPTETYNYYFNGMPRLGWAMLTAVRSKVSALTFTQGDRVATLQIEGGFVGFGGIGGATVTVVVSTRQLEQR